MNIIKELNDIILLMEEIKNELSILEKQIKFKDEKILMAIKTLELIAQDQFNGRDGEPDPMNVILRMRVEALNALEKLK